MQPIPWKQGRRIAEFRRKNLAIMNFTCSTLAFGHGRRESKGQTNNYRSQTKTAQNMVDSIKNEVDTRYPVAICRIPQPLQIGLFHDVDFRSLKNER